VANPRVVFGSRRRLFGLSGRVFGVTHERPLLAGIAREPSTTLSGH
jgi:hypothetical protein